MRRKIYYTIAIVTSCIFLSSLLLGWTSKPGPAASDIKKAAAKSLLLLQKSAVIFTNNAMFKCASCHHNTLTAMADELGAQKGISIVDSLRDQNIVAMQSTLRFVCNPNHINEFLPVNFAIPYILVGLAAENYPADIYTDMSVNYVISQANTNGSFLTESNRVPLETGDVHLTVMAIRSIELYGSKATDQVKRMVDKTRQWLEKQTTNQQQEVAFQLMGLQWCGSDAAHKNEVAKHLKAMQNKDGGWSQLPTLPSDAYATGQALYSLYLSGMATPDDEVYKDGLNYLLKTQNEQGAWIVQTRSFPIQPFVDSQFPPYNRDQFISAAGSNWATMALLNALPDKSK